MFLERAAVNVDEFIALFRDNALVQRLQRQHLAVRRGQHAGHDQAFEDAFDVGAGYLRHHLVKAHARVIALQVGGQVGLLFIQA
ncbi:hypothetical protein D3C77_675650 [compost metagenome]